MGIEREKLAEVLGRNGVDASGLEELFDSGEGKVFGLRSGGGEAALEVWEVLYDLVGQTGCWPVLLGGQEAVERHREAVEDTVSMNVRELIERGTERRAVEWLEERRRELTEERVEVTEGAWPEGVEPASTFHIPFDVMSGEALEEVIIGLVPTVRPWEVAAFLKFGGFNECPPPDVHVGVWQRWYERHRAVVVGVSGSIVEMLVERPPRKREEALELAGEQYAYCVDIVEQGVETKAALAACLLGGRAWYFWWD